MITPVDIKNQEFKKSFRGYDELEVDQFLDSVIKSYEKIYNENVELKDKILVLTDKLEQYANLEETLKDTLLVAQKTADEIVKSSKEKADLIVNEAELKSKKILDSTSNKAVEIESDFEKLKKEAFIFKTRYKTFIESQMATLDEFKIGSLEDIEKEVIQDKQDMIDERNRKSDKEDKSEAE